MNLLTYQEAADQLSMSKSKFRRMVMAGQIPRYTFGERCHRIDQDDVDRIIKSSKQWPYQREEKATGATSPIKVIEYSDPLGQPKSARLKRSKLN